MYWCMYMYIYLYRYTNIYIYWYMYIWSGCGRPPPPQWFPPLFKVAVVEVTVSSLSVVWLRCFHSPLSGVAVVVVVVSSTPCGVAEVDSGFIHPLWCGCGAGDGGGNGCKASLSCRRFGCQTYFNIIGLRFRVHRVGMQKCGPLMP